jgi:dephospho-CoA kinase
MPSTSTPKDLLDMRLIGLTGNIATGKSAVARRLSEYGAFVIDADQVARDIVEPGQPALARIVEAFGPEILLPTGALNRGALGRVVFNDPEQLARLEAITHPVIRADILARISAQPPSVTIVLEAIKLLERGYQARCAQVWVTTCPEATQIARLMSARGMRDADARARVAGQAPQAGKIAQADVVIDTAGSLDETLAQVDHAWRAYQAWRADV